MKYTTILLIPVILMFYLVFTGCPHPIHDPTPTPTVAVLFDDFSGGTNKSAYGGYWYTFDDLSASTDNITCGNSQIQPMSANAAYRFYGYATETPVPTFVMQSYTLTSETKPAGVISAYYARVSGTVDRSGYPFGFAGFGCNILEAAADGSKNTIDASALGYKRLVFWYKNGPSLGAGVTVPWKVKLPTSYSLGACSMGDADNQPVCNFTSTKDWQKFDKVLATDFAPENWGSTACGARAALTTCIPGQISYIAGGGQFKCTAVQALSALNAFQWQTNFTTTTNNNAFDLEIAEVTFIK